MTEHEHVREVADELVRLLAEAATKSGAWDKARPYETRAVKLVIMANKLQRFIQRLPPVPDETRTA